MLLLFPKRSRTVSHILSLPPSTSTIGVWQNYSKITPFSKNEKDRIEAGLKSHSRVNFSAALAEMAAIDITGKLKKDIDYVFSLDGSFEINAGKIKKKEETIKEAARLENEKLRQKLSKAVISAPKINKVANCPGEPLNTLLPLKIRRKRSIAKLPNGYIKSRLLSLRCSSPIERKQDYHSRTEKKVNRRKRIMRGVQYTIWIDDSY